MEPFYKIGDKVKVKSIPSSDYPYCLTSEMCKEHGGKIVTINRVITRAYDIEKCSSRCPHEKLDGCKYGIITEEGVIDTYNWSSPMFEKVWDKTQPLKINIGTKHVKFNFNN